MRWLQDNAAKALIIMVNKKMPEHDFFTAELIPKNGKNWKGTIDTQKWLEILQKDSKLECLTFLSGLFGTTRPESGLYTRHVSLPNTTFILIDASKS